MNKRIKLLRESLKLSRSAFGEKIGVSGDVINNLERGRVEIKNDRIKLICSVFNINEDWLRTGKGEMKRNVDMDFENICADIGVHDEKAREAIMKYYELSDDDKELWWRYVERFMK